MLLYERYPPPAFDDDATRAAGVVAVRCIDATGASTPGGSPGGGAKGQAVKALRKALRQYRESALAPHGRAALLRHLSQSRSPLQLLRVPPTPTACASRPTACASHPSGAWLSRSRSFLLCAPRRPGQEPRRAVRRTLGGAVRGGRKDDYLAARRADARRRAGDGADRRLTRYAPQEHPHSRMCTGTAFVCCMVL